MKISFRSVSIHNCILVIFFVSYNRQFCEKEIFVYLHKKRK